MFRTIKQVILKVEMTGASGGSIEANEASSLEDSIQDGYRQIPVV